MKKLTLILSSAAVLSFVSAGAAAAQTPPKPAAAAPVVASDLKAGAQIRDNKGAPVGTIVSMTDQGVEIDTGQTKIGVPLSLFSKDDKGPMLTITADQFNQAVAKAHARAEAAKAAQPAAQPAQDQKPH